MPLTVPVLHHYSPGPFPLGKKKDFSKSIQQAWRQKKLAPEDVKKLLNLVSKWIFPSHGQPAPGGTLASHRGSCTSHHKVFQFGAMGCDSRSWALVCWVLGQRRGVLCSVFCCFYFFFSIVVLRWGLFYRSLHNYRAV